MSPMLHPMRRGHWLFNFSEDFSKVFTIYGHGNHLVHVTHVWWTNFYSPGPWRFHMKFGFDWPNGFWEDVLRVWMTHRQTIKPAFTISSPMSISWPRWLSWMRRPTGDQEAAGSTPAEIGNILSWRLIMKYFIQSFSPFRWFKKGSCLFVCVEVLRPSQPNGVMSSAVSLPNHTFTGQA